MPTRDETLTQIGTGLANAKEQALFIKKTLESYKKDPVAAKAAGFDVPETEPLPTPERFSRLTPTEQTATDVLAAPMGNQQSQDEIQAAKAKAAQAEIDALNKVYQDKIAEQRIVNQGQERQTSSVSTLTGLAGSSEANVQANKTEALGGKQLDAIRNEQAAAIQQILSDVRTSAAEEARQQTLDVRQSARDVLDMRVKNQTDAVNNLKVLSQTGITAKGLKASDPEAYQTFVDRVGNENMLKAYLTLNRPQNTIIDKKIVDGQYIIAYQNPLTGKTKVETTDLGLPSNYTKTVDAGDRILAIPNDWDGSPDSLITINKGISPKDIAAAKAKVDKDKEEDVTPEQVKKQITQLKFLKDTIKDAKDVVHAAGRSGARKAIEGVTVGATDYTRLEAFTNTLRTNVLTLMTDPSIKKFFGPQMSEADVRLMTAGGTTLNPELQSPEDMKEEFTRLEGLLTRMEDSLKEGEKGESKYRSERSQLKQGEILIERNGQIGAIPEGEFNPQTDKKL